MTVNIKTYALNSKKIHLDIDPTEINKNVSVDIGLVGDIKETFDRLLPHIEKCNRSEWIGHINEIKGEASVRDIQNLPDLGHLYAAHVVHDLWKATSGNALLVTDVGQNQMWSAQYYKHDQPYKAITSGGLGTMGFALPAAIGAKVACPDEEVWAIAGDGGFQMTQAELQTAAQHGVKVNIAVINNGFLGMVRQWQEFFYEKRYSETPITSPDFVKIAEAHGHLGILVSERPDVAPAIERARTADGTALIEFRVEKEDSVYPMVPSGADLDEMIRRPEENNK